ncbi:MAG: hypothetical protein HOW73_20330 [Polyangiaceae bacterium]|nr:hypothetical protein [Polyangiaceae bacterium]
MGALLPLRQSFVAVVRTERTDRPIGVVVESRSSTSSGLLTLEEAEAAHAMLGQLIADVKRDRERGLPLALNQVTAEYRDAAREHDAWARGVAQRAFGQETSEQSPKAGMGAGTSSSDAFAPTVGAAHNLAPILTDDGNGGGRVRRAGDDGMVPSRLERACSSHAEGSESVAPRGDTRRT